MLELAKSLKLVAPITMSADAQMVWLQAAADALDGMRADEVRDISAELRRKVTRPAQIVPEIANLVAAKRSRAVVHTPNPFAAERRISIEAQERRAKATSQMEIEAAWQFERDARMDAGLHVEPIAKPLNSAEIAALSPSMVKMGLKCGALAYRDGRLVNTSA